MHKLISTLPCTLSIMLALVGCTGTSISRQNTAFINSDDMFYARDATGKAVDTFLAGGSSFNLPQVFETANTRISRIFGYQIGVATRRESPLTPRVSLFGSASASLGQGRLRLPDGAGVLIEPINMDYTSLMAEGQLGIRQRLPVSARVSVGLAATLGMKAALTATHISSPVLAIANNSRFADPYIGARVEIGPATLRRHPLGFGLEIRRYRSMGQTASASLSLGF